MNLEQLEVRLGEAYDNLLEATGAYREHSENVRALEVKMEFAKNSGYLKGDISGKNATERQACEWEYLKDDILELESAKAKEAILYRDRELAEINVSYLRAILRIKEISQEE